MPAIPIANLPVITAVTLDDAVIIEQTVGVTTTTYQGTVRQLLEIAAPVPTITTLTLNGGNDELTVEGDNILPTTLITIDGLPYPIKSYTSTTATTATAEVEIGSSLGAGTYTVVVKNFINEATGTITV